jgi:hypothetical protein
MTWEGPLFLLHITTVHLELLRTIHKSTWIAAIESFEIEKAEPFLTLPQMCKG